MEHMSIALNEAGIGSYNPKNCHALIIGIDHYQSLDIIPLRNATSDGKAISKILKQNYGWNDIAELYDADATRQGILHLLNNCIKLGSDQSLLIYYAGRGMNSDDGDAHIIPVEGNYSQSITHILISDLMSDFVKRLQVRHLLMIFDTSFTWPEPFVKEKFLIDDYQSIINNLPHGYHNVWGNKSRWVITSGDGERVPDSGAEGYSAFNYKIQQFLLDELPVSKRIFSSAEMFAHSAVAIESFSPVGQRPVYYNLLQSNQVGHFVFVRLTP
jgi:hypothetical protein